MRRAREMNTISVAIRSFSSELSLHKRVIWALLMRELSTRYGRDNIGFVWLILEPLVFACAVTLMWSIIKGKFENGVPVPAFTATGYMSVILTRHMVGHGVHAVSANSTLLYHRYITILHLFICRLLIEFISVTLAFIVIYSVMAAIGAMHPPENLPMLYVGWFLLGWLSFGLALIMGSLSALFEFVERIVQVVTYILVPLSGSFFMLAWIPPQYRKIALLNPFTSTTESVRAGYFGEAVHTYYNIPYACAWAAGLTLVGLTLALYVRDRTHIE